MYVPLNWLGTCKQNDYGGIHVYYVELQRAHAVVHQKYLMSMEYKQTFTVPVFLRCDSYKVYGPPA